MVALLAVAASCRCRQRSIHKPPGRTTSRKRSPTRSFARRPSTRSPTEPARHHPRHHPGRTVSVPTAIPTSKLPTSTGWPHEGVVFEQAESVAPLTLPCPLVDLHRACFHLPTGSETTAASTSMRSTWSWPKCSGIRWSANRGVLVVGIVRTRFQMGHRPGLRDLFRRLRSEEEFRPLPQRNRAAGERGGRCGPGVARPSASGSFLFLGPLLRSPLALQSPRALGEPLSQPPLRRRDRLHGFAGRASPELARRERPRRRHRS